MADRERLLAKAASATRASKYVAFSRVDELLTDVVALANVGGGIVITAEAPDVSTIRRELAFDDVELATIERGPVLIVGPAGESPLTLDSRGAFFRHGAKSAPATRGDLGKFVERRLAAARKRLIVDIKRVISAPEGSEIVAIERGQDERGERVIRITTDVHAPLYRAVDFDVTHPYRQKELIAAVNTRLAAEIAVNSYDFQAIKHTYDIDPDFVHLPRFGTNQYSQAFVDWLIEHIEGDPEFVTRARAHYHELRVSASKSRG